MKKPNFFIVGAPKCGTTALYSYLSQHPDVYMSPEKEPHFFSNELLPHYGGTVTKLSDYLALFSHATNQARIGEGSTTYLHSEEAPKKIKEFSPGSRIIIMLRAPVDMIYSLHSYQYYWKGEPISNFDEAVKAGADRPAGRLKGHLSPRPAYLLNYQEVAKYKKYVQHYISVFGSENVHVIDYDQFKRNTDRVFRETCQFLGIDSNVPMAYPVVNETKTFRSIRVVDFTRNPPSLIGSLARAIVPQRVRRFIVAKIYQWSVVQEPRSPMDPKLRAELNAEFAPDVEHLGRMLGRDFRHWIK